MTLEDVIDYCAAHNIDGRRSARATTFPDIRRSRTDEYLYNLKRKAYINGVTISGTGVRNDFTLSDPPAEGSHPSW